MTSKTTQTRKFRPSPALVISCLALFMALTGSAFAVSKATISSKQIVNGSVRTADLAPNSVKSPKIADGTIGAQDLSVDSVDFEEIALNAVDTGEIAKGAVGPDELAVNSVASANVAPDSLTATDLAPNSVGSSEVTDQSLTQADLGTNSVGETEVAANAISADELAGVSLRSNSDELVAGQNGAVAVGCQAGEQIISGGGATNAYGVEMTSNAPSGNGWFYSASNKTAATRTITVYALCLTP
jgi:hypothetical protein